MKNTLYGICHKVYKNQRIIVIKIFRDFPGGPVVKTSPSNAGGAGSIPGGELRSTWLTAKKPKHRTEAIL